MSEKKEVKEDKKVEAASSLDDGAADEILKLYVVTFFDSCWCEMSD
jgi:hypothetical protein